MINQRWSFLSSIRFWKLGIVAVAQFLATQGIIPHDVANLLAVWLGGSVAVGTVDRLTRSSSPVVPPQ